MSLLETLRQQLTFRRRGVRYLRQARPENCTQTVLAMAFGTTPEQIERVAGTTGRLTVQQALRLIGQFGVATRPMAGTLASDFWSTFWAHQGGPSLRGLGFRLPKGSEPLGHAVFLVGASIYDPATGERSALNAESVRQLDWLVLLPERAPAGQPLQSLPFVFA